jgi:WD40 repeat protein
MSEAPIPSPSEDEQTRRPPGDPSEEAQMLGDLQRLYQPLVDRNTRSLERVRTRLAQQEAHISNRTRALQFPHASNRRGYIQEKFMQPILPRFSEGGAWRRGIGTLAAVVLLVVLVGSLIAVFAVVHSGKNGPSTAGSGITTTTPPHPTPTSTSTSPTDTVTVPQGMGTTVYTSPVSYDDFYAFAWSPDGKRIAASTQSQVQIWDATTGKHPLTYTPNGQGGSVLALSWSPDGKELAVGAISSDGVEIINPDTGALIRTFNPGLAYGPSGRGNSPALSAAGAFSGGAGVTATAWSPDGKLMASAFLGATYGYKIVVWNPATGAQVSTFTGHTGEILSLAWSADGTYIASSSYDKTVQVWNARTRQVIFFRNVLQAGALAWSPSGLRLVFTSAGNTFLVWDIPTNTLITSYQAQANFSLAWSPDGKAIAVASNSDVIIWNAATGAHIYTYTQTGNQVRSLAWSPDGKYIVSGGNNEGGGNYAKVWVAGPLT